MAVNARKIIVRIVVGIGFVLLDGTIALIALAWTTDMGSKIECDRTAGQLRVVYPLATHEIPLADITGFELGTEQAGLGRGARVETTYGIVAKLRDGERKLTTFTGDPATVATYREGVERLRAFLAGAEPTLTLTFDAKDSRAARTNNIATLILVAVLILGGLIAYFVFSRHG